VVWGWIFKMGLGPRDGVLGKSLVADLTGLDNFHPQVGKMIKTLSFSILLLLLVYIHFKHLFPAYFPFFPTSG
jgi:hypothetical protein